MIKEEVLNSFSGKGVLVTGGTGLIGRQIINMLCEAGARVQSVSLDKITLDGRVEYRFGDITNFEFCKEITKGMDFVFHIASSLTYW